MATRALTQACHALRVPRRAVCYSRCSSTTPLQVTRSTPPPTKRRPKPSNQEPKLRARRVARNPHETTNAKKSSDKYGRPDYGDAYVFAPGEWATNPKALDWAIAHNVGFPEEQMRGYLRDPNLKNRLAFRFSRRQTFRHHHVEVSFTGNQQVNTEYQLYRYEEKLAVPLWVHIGAPSAAKPVVRNFARRRAREGLRKALAEKGYTLEGKVAEAEDDGGGSENRGPRQAPKRELKGTISLFIQDAVSIANLSKQEHVWIGRDIVRFVEQQQSRP